MPTHCLYENFALWPKIYAMLTAIKPAIKNLKADIDNGGATWTIMRADVKALDQISAKVNPIITDLMSIDFSTKKAAVLWRP